MDVMNFLLNLVVPPAGLLMLAFAWPSLAFFRACEWALRTIYGEDMEGKVVIITGASSGIGEQIAYQYAKRRANLVLVARREHRLRSIREKARTMGAKNVLVIAADVVKEEDCKRFMDETINQYGHLDHLVNNAGLGHSFLFEEAGDTSGFAHMMDINFWGSVYPTFFALPHLRRRNGRIIVNASVEGWLPMPRMSLYNAAKAAVVSFYETLRIEIGGAIGITIATPGWIESDMTRGRFMTEEGEVLFKEEPREMYVGPYTVAYTEECARTIVSGACKGQRYVRFPMWYNVFFLYRVFVPDLLDWTYRLLFLNPFITTASKDHTLHDFKGARKKLLITPTSLQLLHHQQHQLPKSSE